MPLSADIRSRVMVSLRLPYPLRLVAITTMRKGLLACTRNSEPMSSLSPSSFASTWARTTPASEHSSVMASAAYPSASARSTSSSACDAPRRKEKFDMQCSSA